MEEDEGGEWVRYSDYAALIPDMLQEARNEALREAADDLLRTVYNFINCWKDPYDDKDAAGNSLYDKETRTNVRLLGASADKLRSALAAAPQPAPEPVAWYTDDHLTDKSATTYDKTVAERWRQKGWPVTPLYADALLASGLRLPTAAQPETPTQPVTVTYRNWRGEVSERSIIPEIVWFGSTDWHPEPQWLVKAFDTDKGAKRDFALKDFCSPQQPETLAWAVVGEDEVRAVYMDKDGADFDSYPYERVARVSIRVVDDAEGEVE